jgi:CheY-like chemotaxis protein
MKILLVEDDIDKARDLREFISGSIPAIEVKEARSFHSALKALCDRTVKYDGVLLDMSMPNFDVSEREPSGGAQENFAGRDLLTQMKMRQRKVPTIVVTMFDGFGEGAGRVSIDDLHAEMMGSFADFYVGHVYYSQAEDAWKTRLEQLLKGIRR